MTPSNENIEVSAQEENDPDLMLKDLIVKQNTDDL